MKHFFKTSFMNSMIKKKIRKRGFDFEKSESYQLDMNGDYSINNSYYFSGHNIETKENFYCRLGHRADGTAEAWVFYRLDGKNYVLKENLYRIENCPLKVTRKENGWLVEFDGMLENDEGDKLDSKLNLFFESNQPAIDFFCNMPSIRTAIAMAREKWSKEYFNELNNNNQIHYEQEGLLKGSLKVGEVNFDINLPAVRDHSYGKRYWGYMNNHMWLMSVCPDFQLNLSVVSYPVMFLEVGHIRIKDSVNYMTKIKYDRKKIIEGKVPEYLEIEYTFTNKKKVLVKVTPFHENTYLFENGDYRLIEGLATFEIGDYKGQGIFEIGFNKDEKKWLNGKDVKEVE